MPIVCLNNGTLVGNVCYCTPLFSGPRCQEAQIEIVAQIVAKINVTVKVLNETYNLSMSNLSSSIAQAFVERFKKQVEAFYREIISDFYGIKVTQLSNGSVNVHHQVLFYTPVTDFKASYDVSYDSLHKELGIKYCNDTKKYFCYVAMNQVHPTSEELNAACKNEELIPKEYQQYFQLQNVNGEAKCLSNCSLDRKEGRFPCKNGTCKILPSGPSCYCQQSDYYWFLGSHCEQSISKVGVAVGVALGLAALLLVILILAVLLCWRRCRPREKDPRLRGILDEENWYEKESEWNAGPQGIPGQNPEADSMPGPEGGAGSDQPSSSNQGSFRPRLDKVDTSLQTRIARPQLTRL